MFEVVQKNIKAITAMVVILIVMGIAYTVYITINHAGKIGVTVSIVPGDARTTVDGQSVSSGTVYLKPGNYTVRSSKTGFADYSQQQFIDEDKKTILVTLTPKSDEAKKWVQDNQQKYTDNEGLGGQAADEQGIAFRNKNPITDVLPYENLLFTLGYKNDPRDPSGNSIILTVDAAQGYRNAAVEQIRALGYDPTDFTINFNDYTNPFSL